MAELLNDGAVLHVRFDGRSLDIPLDDLDIGPGSDDREIKQRWRAASRCLRQSCATTLLTGTRPAI